MCDECSLWRHTRRRCSCDRSKLTGGIALLVHPRRFRVSHHPPTTTHRDLKKILGFEDTTDASPLLSSTKALLRLYGMVAPQKPAKAAKMTMQTVQHLAQRDGDGRGLGALDPSLHGTVLLVRGVNDIRSVCSVDDVVGV